MKLLILFIFTFAGSAVLAKTNQNKLKEIEVDNYLASARALDDEKQLSESELFKSCKEDEANTSIKKVEECIQKKFNDPDFDPKEYADKTNLKSFNLNASKNSTSIRKYLSERLTNALYGEAKKGKLKKLVDHEIYSKLYRSQIGKNILMDVSSYCLVNLGFKDDPYKVVNHCIVDESGKIPKGCDQIKTVGNFGPNITGKAITFKMGTGFEDKNENKTITRVFNSEKFTVESSVNNIKTIWDKLTEYEPNEACTELVDYNPSPKTTPTTYYKKGNTFCGIKTIGSDGKDMYTAVRNQSYLNAVKEIEFKLGADYMRGKYQFCAFTAIKNMCEVYRCKNIYKGADASDEAKAEYSKKCDPLGITDYKNRNKDTSYTDNYSGLKACSLMAKLKQYRNNIAALDVIDKHNQGLHKKTGLSAQMYQGGYYTSGNTGDEKSVEDLTSISSAELAGKKVDIGLGEEEIKKLREECITPDGSLATEKKCQQLVSDLDEKNAKDVSAEIESETQLNLKKIAALKDREKIKEYLIKHGLSKYIAQIDTLEPSILKSLIADEYTSERDALKKSMMDKFNRLTNKDPKAPAKPGADNFKIDEGNLATESISNLEKQKETIQTLFQYNNVISSYMSAKIGEGDDAKSTELSYQRDIELEGMSEFGDKNEKQKYENYKEMFKDEKSRKTSGNEQMNVDINFIDSLLGNKEDKAKNE